MDLNHLVEHGRAQTIERLMTMLVDAEGIDATPAEEINKTVTALRNLADTLERAPGSIKGLVLITAEHLVGDQEGINRTQVLVGSQPFVAAAYMVLEPYAAEAMHACLPHLLAGAMADAETAQEAANHG